MIAPMTGEMGRFFEQALPISIQVVRHVAFDFIHHCRDLSPLET